MGDSINIPGKTCICRKDLQKYRALELNGKTLFDRYGPMSNVIKKHIDPQYQDFLAHPVRKGDTIAFYGKKNDEERRSLSELQGEELERYAKIKEDTLAHYNDKIGSLRSAGKTVEADYLADAVKHIRDDYVYCYDGRVVLGVWGVVSRDNVKGGAGVVSKRADIKDRTPRPPSAAEPAPLAVAAAPEEPENRGSGEAAELPAADEGGAEPDDYGKTDTETGAGVRKKRPWWKRLLWLWALLLLLLLLWLLKCRCCDECVPAKKRIPYPIGDKPWADTALGGIYNPGNPYKPKPTPPGYKGALPPFEGRLPPRKNPPIDRKDPQGPPVIGDVLNILMENEDKSIMDLAKEFKAKYPVSEYSVVYYDDVVKRMQVKVPPAERESLKKEIPPKFEPEYSLFVFDEALFESNYTPDDPAFNDADKSWYLHAVNAPQAWDIDTALVAGRQKLTVAIVDNGFNLSHPELKDKVVMPYNVWTHSCKVTSQKPDHGTHVAGTALAVANNKKGLLGIAPKCAFMPIQVADARGIMTVTSLTDGVLYALYQGADVVNISLGLNLAGLGNMPEQDQRELINNRFKEEERLWRKVMDIAEKHNAIIVVSAGNDNVLAGITPYQRQKNVIVVSATDKNNQPASSQKADFSNYGEYSTVSAPGVDIYSSVGKNDYKMMSGTSMASPITAGAAALMKSLNESLTAEQIKCILKTTGLKTGSDIGELIQIDKALETVRSGPANWPNCAAVNPPDGFRKETSSCDAKVASGGEEGYLGTFDMQQQSGSFVLDYDTHSVPDMITVYDGADTGGKVIFTYSGSTNGHRSVNINFNKSKVTVKIVGLGRGTVWNFALHCPDGQGANGQNPGSGNSGGFGGPPPAGGINPRTPPPSGNNKDDLLKEREQLKRRVEEIDKKLRTLR